MISCCPAGGTRGLIMTIYATLSHRKIRGWAHLREVEQHNDRQIVTPAREGPDRPMPVELIKGAGDIVDRTKALLTSKGVPHKLRKNTVLAYEDVFGASPEYWDRRYPDGWRNVESDVLMRDPLVLTCLAHVRSKYGDKLVSVRLHLDEKTPHLHVVSLPLVTSMHKKRGRKRKDGIDPPAIEKTTLYASHVGERGGPGRRLEIEHDEWAAACGHIKVDGVGLERGKRGSELTDEERRDRKLRDPKASRQGEERARLLREQRELTAAAEKSKAAANALLDAASQAFTEAVAAKADAEALRGKLTHNNVSAEKDRTEAELALAQAKEARDASQRDRQDAFLALAAAEEERRNAKKARQEAEDAARAARSAMAEAADLRRKAAEAEQAAMIDGNAAALERKRAENDRRKLEAVKAGIEAWAAGDIVGADVKADGGKQLLYRDGTAKSRLQQWVQAAGLEIWTHVRDLAAKIAQRIALEEKRARQAIEADQQAAADLKRRAAADNFTAKQAKDLAKAFADGVEAWAKGEIRGTAIRESDGVRVIVFASSSAKERLRPLVQPAYQRVVEWIEQKGREIAAIVDHRVGTLTEQRREAAAKLVQPSDIVAAAERVVRPQDIADVISAQVTKEQATDAAYQRLVQQAAMLSGGTGR